MQTQEVKVSSEVGVLRRVLVHSPDRGIGRVTPSRAQDWLFDDIVHLKLMRHEYDTYLNTLLYFLDPQKIKGRLQNFDYSAIVGLENDEVKAARYRQYREYYKPDRPGYFNSDKVIEVQNLLAQVIASDDKIKNDLVIAVCAFEGVSNAVQKRLLELDQYELAKTLISGYLVSDDMLIFSPLPNLIFTRDIGTVINQHILLSKPAKEARDREALLARFIFFHHPIFQSFVERNAIIELSDEEQSLLVGEDERRERALSIEGGDVMLVAPQHLLVGCSERTSQAAIYNLVELLFEEAVVNKITVISIPPKRDYMHVDTILTQVRRDMWVLYGGLAYEGFAKKNKSLFKNSTPPPLIQQYVNTQAGLQVRNFNYIEELLTDISHTDLGVRDEIKFVYSGGGQFPFDQREQWTDGCNLLALREGVVIGYDRNTRTATAFREQGFKAITAGDLLQKFEAGTLTPEQVQNTIILLPSAELSRARGGSHCMSFPILRDDLSIQV